MSIPSRAEYESFLYRIQTDFPVVVSSTLHLFGTSALTAMVQGELELANGVRIRLVEVLDFKQQRIISYSYTVFQGAIRIR